MQVRTVDQLRPLYPSRDRPPYPVPWEHLPEFECAPWSPSTAPDIAEPGETEWQLILHYYRGSGPVFDGFQGGLLRRGRKPHHVVARLSDLSELPRARAESARGAIRREAELYNSELLPLQGRAVARFYGVFTAYSEADDMSLLVSVMEDCGGRATPEDAPYSFALMGPHDKWVRARV